MNEIQVHAPLGRVRFRYLEITCFLFLVSMNLNYLLGMSQLSRIRASQILELVFAAAGIGFMILHNITGRYRLSEFLAIALLVLIGLLAYTQSGAMTFLKLILFWLGCRKVDERKLMKYEIASLIISMAVVAASVLLGLTSLRFSLNPEKFVFGFKNPNNAPAFWTAVLFSLCLYRGESLTKKSIFAQMAFTLLVYRLTKCRSMVGVLMLFYVLLLADRVALFHRLFRHLSKLTLWLFFFFTAGSLMIAAMYDHGNANWYIANDLMSWRPYIWSLYYAAVPLSLLGSRLPDLGALDNAYLMLIFNYGILVYISYFLIFWYLMRISSRQNNTMLALAIICYEIYFVFEFTPLLVNVNPLLLIGISSISIKQDEKTRMVQGRAG